VQEHTGQLAAEIRSSREEFVVKVLGKRKHGSKVDEGDFENVSNSCFPFCFALLLLHDLLYVCYSPTVICYVADALLWYLDQWQGVHFV